MADEENVSGLDKAAKIAGAAKTIYLTLAIMMSGVTWGATTYFSTIFAPKVEGGYMTVAMGGDIALQIRMDSLNEAISDGTQKLQYITDPEKIRELKGMILYKKEKRDALIKKHNLQGK